ncbi:MAG: hypothetical protein KAJ29_04155 [Alphaproteobacteria bacterium]|nr:hypothetical protein [Alphaproteobacteria bacterium]
MRILKIILLFLVTFLFPINVQAEETVLVKEKTDEERCQEIWGPLWSKVQAGDVGARVEIIMAIVFGNLTHLPGHSDYLAKIRDIVIFAVHGVGITEHDIKIIDTLYYKHLEGVPGNTAFFKCIESSRS